MAISISNNYINNAGSNGINPAVNQNEAGQTASQQGRYLAASDLRQGQTISGEIVSRDGENVTLKLSDGQLLNAQISRDSNLAVGRLLSFEVHGNESGKVALRPLYANLNSSSTINVALKAAGIPQTASAVSMTSAMMDAGMSIDRNSLQSMAREVNSHPLAQPESIVQMTKLGLPIDELNVTQYENYKNFEHQVINDITNLSNSLSDAIVESIISGDSSSIDKLSTFMAEIDTSLITEEEIAEDTLAAQEQENIINNDTKVSPFSALKNAADIFMDAIRGSDESVKNGAQDHIPESVETGDVLENIPKGENSHTVMRNLQALTGIEVTENPQKAETAEFIKNVINTLSNEKISPEYKEIIKGELSKLILKDDIKEILKDAVKSQMVLTPEKVGKEGSVNELFSRLMKMSKAAVDFAGNSGTQESQNIAQSAQNIQNNVNFMNQLNEMVNYVQLPLKMYQENAHGELYVYSKHKSLEETDGNISALLHLDMEHLGPMDVYVSMKNYTNVSTNFRLADVKTLDFIAENIEMLNERLTQKGYNMTTNFTTGGSITGEDKPITDEFFKDSPEDEGMKVISKLQFDVRA